MTTAANAPERLAEARNRIIERKKSRKSIFDGLPGGIGAARSLRASEGDPSWQRRRGRLVSDTLSATRFEIDDLELMVGRHVRNTESPGPELDEAIKYLERYPGSPGQTGHCELDLRPLVERGLSDLVRENERLAEESRAANGECETTWAYESFAMVLGGLRRMIENAAEAAEETRATADGERAVRLDEIARSCRRIAVDAPETFLDGLHLLWLVTFGVMHSQTVFLVAPGHIDRLLAPLYEKEKARGTLSRERALELIEAFYLLINDYTFDGLAVPVMVGGRNTQGEDVTNDLSYLCLEALRRTRMVYPTVGICWHSGTPADLVDLAIDLITEGNPNPAFFGDETIQRGLRGAGVPAEEACDYINSTCVEITPSFSSNVWVASPYINVCQILLDEIGEQARREKDGAGGATGFDEFLGSYKKRLAEHIGVAAREQSDMRKVRRQHGRKPLQSVFTRDCIERGRDIDDGGARYNWVECSFVGLANLVDSLEVVRGEVLRQGGMPFADLQALLASDFADREDVRVRFLRNHPKYGNDEPEVDRLFGEMVEFVKGECARYPMEPDGSPFLPGAFAWTMHQWLGKESGATPDGRHAGTPFADGCGPAQGRESHGPAAAILSTTSWDHSPMLGGLAFNMKFSRGLVQSPQGRAGLRDLVLTFLRRGGFETQINVVDADTLKKARVAPDAYRDLVVRIGGYTDYFANLSAEMQDEIILRTEYEQV